VGRVSLQETGKRDARRFLRRWEESNVNHNYLLLEPSEEAALDYEQELPEFCDRLSFISSFSKIAGKYETIGYSACNVFLMMTCFRHLEKRSHIIRPGKLSVASLSSVHLDVISVACGRDTMPLS
jgi:hypothetical protein